jgi:hypothetical protein
MADLIADLLHFGLGRTEVSLNFEFPLTPNDNFCPTI